MLELGRYRHFEGEEYAGTAWQRCVARRRPPSRSGPKVPTPRVELREADQPALPRMPREVAAGLVAARVADVSPTFVADEYRVSGVRKVGVGRIAGHNVRIRPKTPVRRLFAMLGYARAGSAI